MPEIALDFAAIIGNLLSLVVDSRSRTELAACVRGGELGRGLG
jgi:hypothetical protein